LVAVYLAQNRAALAFDLVQQEVKRSNRVEARVLLATTAVQTGNLDLALSTAEKLAADFPDNTDHLFFCVDLYQQKGQLYRAIAVFQKAVSLVPNDPLASAKLGNALAQAGKYPEAVASYRQSLKLRPDDPTLLNNLAWDIVLAGLDLDEASKLATNALQR